MKLTDYQIENMWRQGIPAAQIAHMTGNTVEGIEQVLRERGICVKCNS
jgi:hypothetical protein